MIDAKFTEEVWRGPLRWMICSAMPRTQVPGWELFHSINDFAFGWKVWKPKSLESMCWFKWFECVTIGDFTAFYSVLFDVYFFWGGFGSRTTLPKTNMAPKNRLLEKEILSWKPCFFFKGPCWFSVVFQEFSVFFWFLNLRWNPVVVQLELPLVASSTLRSW